MRRNEALKLTFEDQIDGDPMAIACAGLVLAIGKVIFGTKVP